MTLKTDMASDLDNVFFSTDEFAVAAVYTPSDGTASSIDVIIDKEAPGTTFGMSGTRITCTAKASDMPAANPGETLIIEGTTYKIKNPPHYTADGIIEMELSID
ncbi:MAG: hypothetical protein ABFD50_18930 [Smithella sp.]